MPALEFCRTGISSITLTCVPEILFMSDPDVRGCFVPSDSIIVTSGCRIE